MSLTLDPAIEQRIQRVVANGSFAEPGELLAHALDLIEAEQLAGDWLLQHRGEINAALDESFSQAERGERYSPEESRDLLAKHRAARKAHAA